MKITNLRDHKVNISWLLAAKLVTAACILFYIGLGMANPKLNKTVSHPNNDPNVLTEKHKESSEDPLTHANDAYILAGETETGIIIIGGGMMLMSNWRSPKKIKRKKIL